MKRHKVLFLAAITLCGVMAAPTLTWAAEHQGNGPHQGQGRRGMHAPRARGFMQQIAERLKLTDAQKEKLQATFREQLPKFRELRNDTSLTPEQRREKFKALRKELDTKIQKILTPEQYKEWNKMREERRKRFRNRGQGNRPQPNRPHNNR